MTKQNVNTEQSNVVTMEQFSNVVNRVIKLENKHDLEPRVVQLESRPATSIDADERIAALESDNKDLFARLLKKLGSF